MLLVREVDLRDAGEYTCRAENVAGSVTSTATISVIEEVKWEEATELVSPHFVEPVTSQKVMDGESVLFTCKVTGKPTPQVTWLHNDKPVRETKDITIIQDTEGICQLALAEVFPEDAGQYKCTAVNKVGEAACAASLVVEGTFRKSKNAKDAPPTSVFFLPFSL